MFKANQIIEAIQALGYGKDLNTGLNRWLRSMTGKTGSTNTLWFNYLRGLGYTGSMNTMLSDYYAASKGAAITSPIPTLFRNNEKGVWYDPSDLTTMYQDSVGTTPAVVGQPVGLMLDKSKGLVLGPELVINGTFDVGTTGWTSPNATISVEAGRLKITNVTTSPAIISTPATVTAGKTYAISYTAEINDSSAVTDAIRVQTESSSIFLPNILPVNGLTTRSGLVQATVSGTVIQIVVYGAADTIAYIDNISVKELPGYHATQATSTARPILARHPIGGRRNLLTYTEDFSNSVWLKNGTVTVSSNIITAPDGTITADKLIEGTTNIANRISTTISKAASSITYTLSGYVKPNGRNWVQLRLANAATTTSAIVYFNIGTGQKGVVTTATSWTIVDFNLVASGGGWYRVYLTATSDTDTSVFSSFAATTGDGVLTYTGDGVSGIYIWGAQLEVSNAPTTYQKVTSTYDVTEAGVNDAYYLKFDGVDDSLVTPSIDFSGTDKMSVFAGVRKLSDALAGSVVELGAGVFNSANTFTLEAPGANATTVITARYRGDGATPVSIPYTIAAPVTAVSSSVMNLASPLITLRVNTASTSVVTSTGGGAFSNNPLYVGARSGSSIFLNGHLYSLVVRGALSDASQIAAAESYVNSKTGAY